MEFDIFFSISQTPDSSGFVPSEREMFSNFLNQAEHADKLGFGKGIIIQWFHITRERLDFVQTSSRLLKRFLPELKEWK